MTDYSANEKMILVQYVIKKYENEETIIEKLKTILSEKDILFLLLNSALFVIIFDPVDDTSVLFSFDSNVNELSFWSKFIFFWLKVSIC